MTVLDIGNSTCADGNGPLNLTVTNSRMADQDSRQASSPIRKTTNPGFVRDKVLALARQEGEAEIRARLLQGLERVASGPLDPAQVEGLTWIREVLQQLHLLPLHTPSTNGSDDESYEPRALIEQTLSEHLPRLKSRVLELAWSVQHDVPAVLPGSSAPLRRLIHCLLALCEAYARDGEVVLLITVSRLEDERTALRVELQVNALEVAVQSLERQLKPLIQAGAPLPRKLDPEPVELFQLLKRLRTSGGGLELNGLREGGFGLRLLFPCTFFDEGLPLPPRRLFLPGQARALFIGRDSMGNALLRMMLGEWGLRVDFTSAPSYGHQLVRMAQQARLPYVCILLDLRLPEFQFMVWREQLLKIQPSLITMPLFALHGSSTHQSELRSMAQILWPQDALLRPDELFRKLQALPGVVHSEQNLAPVGQNRPQEDRLGHILVVEDNEVSSRLLVKMLEKLGYGVTSTVFGLEALQRVRTEKLDAVMLDLQLPDLDGFEVARAIFAMRRGGSPLPIIMMSATTSEEERQQCLAMGARELLSKPLRLETVRQTLRMYISPEGGRGGMELLDKSAQLQPTGGSGPVSEELVPLFLDQLSNHHRALLEAFGAGDLVRLVRVAHATRSTCLYLNAQGLAEICDQLRVQGQNNDMLEAGRSLARLTQELDGLRLSLQEEP